MIEQAPILLVAIPILAAALPPLLGLRFENVGWAVATVALTVQAAIAGVLAAAIVTEGGIEYVAGGFEAPYGIELVADGLTAPVVALIALVSLAVLAYARRAGPRGNLFYALYLLLVAGLTGMTVTADVFNLYVFLEITGLAAYGLVASGREARGAVAALKYLLIGTVGASLYLLGVGYLYVATGTLNMAHLTTRLAAVGYGTPLVVAAFALVMGGLAVKIAMYPLHTWQPDAYAAAPDSVSTIVSALVSTVAAYALGRILLSVFTVDFLAAVPPARRVVVALAGVSIVAGSALAVMQTDVQRMLAYSSVSQFGLVVGGFAVATPAAVVGAAIHLVGHAIMKGGLFAASGIVRRRTGDTDVGDYADLASRAPVAAGAFAVLALAMVGVPPAVGFVGKWYIVVGAIDAEAWPFLVVVLASTLLTLAYFARLIEAMYFADRPAAGTATQATDGGDPPVSTGMVAVVVGAAVLAVVLGPAVPAFQAALEPFVQGVLG
jgi:multicomponent Na+:H+ antiporter subunit D